MLNLCTDKYSRCLCSGYKNKKILKKICVFWIIYVVSDYISEINHNLDLGYFHFPREFQFDRRLRIKSLNLMQFLGGFGKIVG